MIWIIDTHEKLRKTLREALALSGSDEVEAFPTCKDAIESLKRNGLYPIHCETVQGTVGLPAVVILEVGPQGTSGLEDIRLLKSAIPDTEILMFTTSDDRDRIFEAISAGASGFLLKKESVDRIVSAVEEIKDGGVPMSPEIARQVINQFKNSDPQSPNDREPASESVGKTVPLSEQELNVLNLLADGLTRKEISIQLGLSPHTIDNYIRRIYKKLHVCTVGGAVAKAFREGLI